MTNEYKLTAYHENGWDCCLFKDRKVTADNPADAANKFCHKNDDTRYALIRFRDVNTRVKYAYDYTLRQGLQPYVDTPRYCVIEVTIDDSPIDIYPSSGIDDAKSVDDAASILLKHYSNVGRSGEMKHALVKFEEVYSETQFVYEYKDGELVSVK